MNTTLAGSLYRVAARIRNPSLRAEYARLQESAAYTATALWQLQLERTQRFLAFAQRHSPFYAEHFRKAGFDPTTFHSTDQLQVLPVLTKADLVRENARIHTDFRFKHTFRAQTSGSSGEALSFARNEQWDSANRAHVMRAYSWYGIRPWDRNGYLWGYDIDPARASRVRFLDRLQNRFRLFRYDKASIRAFAERLRGAAYLTGYSSMIYETAKVLNDLGVQLPHLRLVKGTSEMILDIYQQESRQAFGQRIISEYGATEAGLIAFECPEGRMHINIEDVVLEIADDGTAIVTNLVSYSFPIVRYRLGDIVRLDPDPCPCGRAHPVLAEVLGRRGGVVVGGQRRFPAMTFYNLFKNIAVRDGILLNYRAIQEQPGQCRLLIEGSEARAHIPRIKHELMKYFAADVLFQIEIVSSLPRGRGKAQYFESRLV